MADLAGAPGAAPPSQPTPPPSAGGAAVRFDVSGVKLEDVRLRIRDAMAKLEGDVVLQSFESGRLANQGESPVSLKANVALTQPQVLKASVDGKTLLAL